VTSPADQRQLEKLIRKERPGLLNNLPGDKKRQLLEILSTRIDPAAPGTILTQTQVTTSPVPPAELLYGYNNAFPDGANRLFTLVENQSQHRQQLEDKITSGQLALSRRGQVFAFILAIFLTSTGTLLALKEQKEVAITIFTTTVVGLASVFIVGQWNQKRNLDQKTPKK
jgi:uncharacterized membrane protein